MLIGEKKSLILKIVSTYLLPMKGLKKTLSTKQFNVSPTYYQRNTKHWIWFNHFLNHLHHSVSTITDWWKENMLLPRLTFVFGLTYANDWSLTRGISMDPTRSVASSEWRFAPTFSIFNSREIVFLRIWRQQGGEESQPCLIWIISKFNRIF